MSAAAARIRAEIKALALARHPDARGTLPEIQDPHMLRRRQERKVALTWSGFRPARGHRGRRL